MVILEKNPSCHHSSCSRKFARGQARGQSSSEFLIALGAVLFVAVLAIAMSGAWPSIVSTTEFQRSDASWAAARPFSVEFHAMKPDNMVLSIRNNDPVTLTITEIWLEGVKLNIYNHSVPFTPTQLPLCSGGNCTLRMPPGKLEIISTDNITTSPNNPCGYGANFKYGAKYGMSLRIVYQGQNSGTPQNQTGQFKLAGTCSGYGGCENTGCCGAVYQPCCDGACNSSETACSGSLCVPCGNQNQPCCTGNASECGNGLVCAGTPSTCQCGNLPGQPCCSGTCSNSSVICNATSSLCTTCGVAAGQPCCTGNSCTGASLACNTTPATPLCETCGNAAGKLCCAGSDCSGGTNLTCNGSNFCVNCGGSGEPCCGASSCDSGYQCSSGACEFICGANGEPCCANHMCDSESLGCNWATDLCGACGEEGQPCCADSAPYSSQCPHAWMGCNQTSHLCQLTCGSQATPCCGPTHNCINGGYCNSTEDTCRRCGLYENDPCCPDAGVPTGYSCEESWLGCNISTILCETSCGSSERPCCDTGHTCPWSGDCNTTEDVCR